MSSGLARTTSKSDCRSSPVAIVERWLSSSGAGIGWGYQHHDCRPTNEPDVEDVALDGKRHSSRGGVAVYRVDLRTAGNRSTLSLPTIGHLHGDRADNRVACSAADSHHRYAQLYSTPGRLRLREVPKTSSLAENGIATSARLVSYEPITDSRFVRKPLNALDAVPVGQVDLSTFIIGPHSFRSEVGAEPLTGRSPCSSQAKSIRKPSWHMAVDRLVER